MTGLIITSSDNNVLLNMTSKLSQNVGYVDTQGVQGSITIPAPPAGKKNYYTVVPLVDTQMSKGKLPGVVQTDTYLGWVYSFPTNNWGNFAAWSRIYYGYY